LQGNEHISIARTTSLDTNLCVYVELYVILAKPNEVDVATGHRACSPPSVALRSLTCGAVQPRSTR
jgi:hypothetical protein